MALAVVFCLACVGVFWSVRGSLGRCCFPWDDDLRIRCSDFLIVCFLPGFWWVLLLGCLIGVCFCDGFFRGLFFLVVGSAWGWGGCSCVFIAVLPGLFVLGRVFCSGVCWGVFCGGPSSRGITFMGAWGFLSSVPSVAWLCFPCALCVFPRFLVGLFCLSVGGLPLFFALPLFPFFTSPSRFLYVPQRVFSLECFCFVLGFYYVTGSVVVWVVPCAVVLWCVLYRRRPGFGRVAALTEL